MEPEITTVETTPANPFLVELADALGVATEFWDWQGRLQKVGEDTLVSVLEALGVDARTRESAEASLWDVEKRTWQRLLPAAVIVEQGQSKTFDAHVYAGAPCDVEVRLEDGRVWPLSQVENVTPDREIDGAWYGEATFSVPPDLPLGYHRIHARSDDREAEAQLIVSPQFLGFPQAMGERRIWGYAAQFYSVRSQRSWGVGDLADLADIATWAGTQHNASYVLVNPVHASNPIAPLEPSPYLPTSRRYVNPLYIRVEDIPEYHELSEKKQAKIAALREEAQQASADKIDRDATWRAKIKALRMVFSAGLRPARQMAFDDFRKKEGRTLQLFTTWSALCTEYGMGWRQWPEELQRPSSPAVTKFAHEHDKMITFFAWLQWIVDTQLSQAQLAAKNVGMSIGIVNDLAVGISGDGAEAWATSDVFAQGIHVGAPADGYNQHGQDWGQPPWRPDRLAELGYAPFRTMVNGILRHSGGIRVDHIIGMFRLWWVPEGKKPSEGTYVRYDHEAMIGILALEAYRAGALVVGEDLGTVEPWAREYLRRRGLLGTSILWFEEDEAGHPLPPEAWREYCMASVTTHDLPPTAGFLAGEHVKLRHELGLLTVPFEEELARSQTEQREWLQNLRDLGLLAEGEDSVDEIVLALHRFLTLTPARVLQVALVDAVGDKRTQNQPGTSNEYPNWRVPLSDPDGTPVLLEEIYGSERALRLAAVMNGWEPKE